MKAELDGETVLDTGFNSLEGLWGTEELGPGHSIREELDLAEHLPLARAGVYVLTVA